MQIKPVIELVNEALNVVQEISVEQWQQQATKYLLIDVREKEEAEHGMLPNAFHISKGLLEFQILNHPTLKQKMQLQDSDIATTPIMLYCRSGQRSALAAKTLIDMGFKNVYSLQGGFLAGQQTLS